jgi:hypothetical protein
MEPDFSGYATKANVKCSDGRTIYTDAFAHMDGVTVPLVWQHDRSSPDNVLGHAILENRKDGVYARGFFNDTKAGNTARELVAHKDIKAMSIWANRLIEKSGTVRHGVIREVSLVLSGANPEALIDYVRIQHGDGTIDVVDDEAIITTGLFFEHAVDSGTSGKTMQDIYDSLSQEQADLVAYMVGQALESAASNDGSVAQSDEDGNDDSSKSDDLTHEDEGDDEAMARNVFDQTSQKTEKPAEHVLSHEDVKGIVADAMKCGSMKTAVDNYALAHGIENIDVLFPDAKNLTATPEFNKRRTEWVSGVLNGAGHTPFSRVKSIVADITYDEARARGYVKGALKKEEWFSLTKRTTTPSTVYKKQMLDRDDIIDIVDFDVVSWMKGEMRIMLEEELACAALFGDGREVGDPDKIKDPVGAVDGAGIRSIANDHELYATTVQVNLLDSNSSYRELIDAIIRSRKEYKGSGNPTLYTTEDILTEMLLLRDTLGRRYYPSEAELASELRVSNIVTVEPMTRDATLVAILVNMADYNFGADRGGAVSMFDDFDIDYNQYKYLIETRVSGALTKIKSAIVIRQRASGSDVMLTPTAPTFVASTGVVTIPTQTHVTYKNLATDATLSAGAQTALTAGSEITVVAVAASGYYFNSTAEDHWTFARPHA